MANAFGVFAAHAKMKYILLSNKKESTKVIFNRIGCTMATPYLFINTTFNLCHSGLTLRLTKRVVQFKTKIAADVEILCYYI